MDRRKKNYAGLWEKYFNGLGHFYNTLQIAQAVLNMMTGQLKYCIA